MDPRPTGPRTRPTRPRELGPIPSPQALLDNPGLVPNEAYASHTATSCLTSLVGSLGFARYCCCLKIPHPPDSLVNSYPLEDLRLPQHRSPESFGLSILSEDESDAVFLTREKFLCRLSPDQSIILDLWPSTATFCRFSLAHYQSKVTGLLRNRKSRAFIHYSRPALLVRSSQAAHRIRPSSFLCSLRDFCRISQILEARRISPQALTFFVQSLVFALPHLHCFQ